MKNKPIQRVQSQVSRGFTDFWEQRNDTGSHLDYNYGWIEAYKTNETRIKIIKESKAKVKKVKKVKK